jgi:hypothetical protein
MMNVQPADTAPNGGRRSARSSLTQPVALCDRRARPLSACDAAHLGSQAKLLVPLLAGRAIGTLHTSGTEHIGRAALITVATLLVYVIGGRCMG